MTSASAGAEKVRLAQSELAAGRLAPAIDLLRAAARLDRDSPRPRLLLAFALSQAGRAEEAIRILRRLCDSFPNSADAWFNLGNLYRSQRRFDEALGAFERAARLSPDNAGAHINLAYLLVLLGKFEKAEAALHASLTRLPDEPDLLVNLAQIQRATHRLEEAIATLDRCIALAPGHAGYRLTRAIVLGEAGHTEHAIQELGFLADQPPVAAHARFARGQILLAREDYLAGWKDYLWRPDRVRWLGAQGRNAGTLPPSPQELRGRAVVLCGEQGLGDTLFFLRFAPLVTELAASVRLEVDARLHAILPPHWKAAPPDGAIRILIGDVPALSDCAREAHAFRVQSDAVRVARLREQLSSCGPPPYVGLTWQGGVRWADMTVPGESLFKRVPPAALGRAFSSAPPATLVSLQRAAPKGDLATISAAAGRRVHDFAWVNESLADALALLENLDDYVAVSNTNVHLNEALGKQTRALITHPAEWRWASKEQKSPWFPGATLYRQTGDGTWDRALAQLERDLRLE